MLHSSRGRWRVGLPPSKKQSANVGGIDCAGRSCGSWVGEVQAQLHSADGASPALPVLALWGGLPRPHRRWLPELARDGRSCGPARQSSVFACSGLSAPPAGQIRVQRLRWANVSLALDALHAGARQARRRIFAAPGPRPSPPLQDGLSISAGTARPKQITGRPNKRAVATEVRIVHATIIAQLREQRLMMGARHAAAPSACREWYTETRKPRCSDAPGAEIWISIRADVSRSESSTELDVRPGRQSALSVLAGRSRQDRLCSLASRCLAGKPARRPRESPNLVKSADCSVPSFQAAHERQSVARPLSYRSRRAVTLSPCCTVANVS